MSAQQTNQPDPPEEPRFISERLFSRQRMLIIITISALLAAAGFFIFTAERQAGRSADSETVAISTPQPPDAAQSQFDSDASATAAPAVGQRAPEVKAVDIAKQSQLTLPIAGEPQVLEFIATWCKYCRQMTPVLSSEIIRQNPKIRLALIGSARESDNKIKQFSAKFSNQRLSAAPLIINDQDLAIANRYQIQGYPTMIFIDRRGKIEAITAGVQERETLATALKKISD